DILLLTFDYYLCVFSFLFFFSSRRRHTRFSRDWSSDVCSSDLSLSATDALQAQGGAHGMGDMLWEYTLEYLRLLDEIRAKRFDRSEERRVGKECRYRRSPCHWINKKMEEQQYNA